MAGLGVVVVVVEAGVVVVVGVGVVVVVTICVVVGGAGGGVIPIVKPLRPMHSPASTAPMAVHSARQSAEGAHTITYSMQSSQQTCSLPPVLLSTLP